MWVSKKSHGHWQVARFVGKHWPLTWVCIVTPSSFRATWPSRQQGALWTPGLTAEHWVWTASGWACLVYNLGGDVTRAAPLFLAGCHGSQGWWCYNGLYTTVNSTAQISVRPCLRWASLMAQRVKNPPANAGDTGDAGSIPWIGTRRWQPTPVFLPGESHGQRSLAGYNPKGCKESDTTELAHILFKIGCCWTDILARTTDSFSCRYCYIKPPVRQGFLPLTLSAIIFKV